MVVKFTKMQGSGNDFMVVDSISQHVHLRPEQIKRLAHRNFGIGFDQLLLVEPPSQPDIDFKYRIYNADGSEAEQCGNGARCFAKFVRDNRLTNKNQIKVETKRGTIELSINKDGLISVDMGVPKLEPEQIPMLAESYQLSYSVSLSGHTVELSALSMGNPHAVVLVDDVDKAPVVSLGRQLEYHPVFPERANIGFLQISQRNFARLRVWERGVGETLACGTGACAAMVVGRLHGLLDRQTEIKLRGGNLKLRWDGEGQSVMMTGPANRIFEGQVRL